MQNNDDDEVETTQVSATEGNGFFVDQTQENTEQTESNVEIAEDEKDEEEEFVEETEIAEDEKDEEEEFVEETEIAEDEKEGEGEEEVEVEEEGQGGTKKSKVRHMLRKDVKRPSSKWIMFTTEKRIQLRLEHPEYNFKQMAEGLAQQYKDISPEDNARFDELARLDKERYQEQIKNSIDEAAVTSVGGDGGIGAGELVFPVARTKRIVKMDPEVRAVGKEATAVMTKAAELFLGYLARKAANNTALRGAKQIKETDVVHAMHSSAELAFLRLDFPKSIIADEKRAQQDVRQSKALISKAQAVGKSMAEGKSSISSFFKVAPKRKAADVADEDVEEEVAVEQKEEEEEEEEEKKEQEQEQVQEQEKIVEEGAEEDVEEGMEEDVPETGELDKTTDLYS